MCHARCKDRQERNAPRSHVAAEAERAIAETHARRSAGPVRAAWCTRHTSGSAAERDAVPGRDVRITYSDQAASDATRSGVVKASGA